MSSQILLILSEFKVEILYYDVTFAFSQLSQLGSSSILLTLLIWVGQNKEYQRCYVPTGHFLLNLL